MRLTSPLLRYGPSLLALVALLRASSPVDADETQAPRSSLERAELVLGMSTALTGQAGDLGRQMSLGVQCALNEAERNGGVRGRSVRLIVYDDGYEPDRTGPNMQRLVAADNVLAVVGNVGTPTAVPAIQIANAYGTPFFGAFSGAGLLRKSPPDHWVVNYRASYAEEAQAMVNALIEHAGLECADIAFFTQRDAYGDAGFDGGHRALKAHGLADDARVLHVRYERNTVSVERALGELLLAEVPPRAVIMVGTYRPCAAFIRLAHEVALDALFLNVSFVGSRSLQRELGAEGEGVIITQVVPHYDADLALVKEYRTALRADHGDRPPDFISLEGYIATRILLLALERIEGTPDRAAVIESLESLGEFDIGLGGPLNYSEQEHQASHRVWPTILRAGQIVPFDWSELRERR